MPTVTSAGGHLAAPLWQGGVEAGELRLPLQVVAHVAVKAGDASRQQVQHWHLTVMWPLRQRAAQSEDCAQEPRRKWTTTSVHKVNIRHYNTRLLLQLQLLMSYGYITLPSAGSTTLDYHLFCRKYDLCCHNPRSYLDNVNTNKLWMLCALVCLITWCLGFKSCFSLVSKATFHALSGAFLSLQRYFNLHQSSSTWCWCKRIRWLWLMAQVALNTVLLPAFQSSSYPL